jgi:hypothetical protein
MIEKPADIIHHIVGEELGKAGDDPSSIVDTEGKQVAINAHPNWQMGFTVNKKINSKKLIEGIAKESRLFPFFKGDKLSFNSILDTYSSSDFEIKDSDIISYKFDRTKIEDIKTRCVLSYHLDYATDEFTKSTESTIEEDTAAEFFTTAEEGYSNDYYGIEGEQGDDPIEVKYIRKQETAEKLQRFLLAWYCNQHNTCKVKLPLSYLYAEVGDTVAFPELLNGRMAYGEDYSLGSYQAGNRTVRNGQEILPYWMIMGVSKTLEYVELDLIQLHYLDDGISLPPNGDNGDDNGDDNGGGEFPEDWGEYFEPELSLEVYLPRELYPGKRVRIRANAIVWGNIENSDFTWDIDPPVVQGDDEEPVPFMFHGVEFTVPAGGSPYTQQGMDLMELCLPSIWVDKTYTISCTVTDPTGRTVSATEDVVIPEFEQLPYPEEYHAWFGVGVHHPPDSGVSGEVINDWNQYSVPVPCRKFNFLANGGIKKCMVTSDPFGYGWWIETYEDQESDWVSFSPEHLLDEEQIVHTAFRLFISVEVNGSGNSRSATFVVRAAGEEGDVNEVGIAMIKIIQDGALIP